MKGTLTKTPQGWVVEYLVDEKTPVGHKFWRETLSLHPDFIEMMDTCFTSKFTQEVEFEIVNEIYDESKGWVYAKLIHHPVDTNEMIDHVGEVNEMVNHVPDVGKMVSDTYTEKNPFDFVCQDPNCPHCIEEINQMRDDDDLEDDVERFIKQQLGLPQYIEISSLGPIMESQYTLALNCYNKAKETLYTKEDVLKAGEIGEINHYDYKHIVSLLDEAKAINQSLKQPKQ